MDRVAIVTGGSRGIGRAICDRLAADGFRTVVVSTKPEVAQKVAGELRESHDVETDAFGLDIGDFEQVDEMMSTVIDRHGRVDALINNAGVTRDGLLLRMKPEDWDAVIRVNLYGAYNTIRLAARQMLRQKQGAIVNISSVVGLTGNSGQANYAASKAGMLGLTKSVAKELAPKGIRVNAVAPGYVSTDMTDSLSDDVKEDLKTRIPAGRLGTPDDIAGVVSFLCSGDARYVTGQVLAVDGGMVM